MGSKTELIAELRFEYQRWEDFLKSLKEEQITASGRVETLSIKDIIAHLTCWQQISAARMVAAQDRREPDFSAWPAELNPLDDGDEMTDKVNAWIYSSRRDQPWPGLYQEWRERFLLLLDLAVTSSEDDLFQAGKFAWMEGLPLSAILTGTLEHHKEHLDELIVVMGTN